MATLKFGKTVTVLVSNTGKMVMTSDVSSDLIKSTLVSDDGSHNTRELISNLDGTVQTHSNVLVDMELTKQ